MVTPFSSFVFFHQWHIRLWNLIKYYSKKVWNDIVNNIVIIVLLLIYLFFYRFWETQIGNHIIDNFFCTFESNWLTDIIFIFLVCIVVVFSYLNRGKDIKLRIKLFCLIAIGFWVYYRCFNNLCGLNDSSYYMSFISLSSIKLIKYVDIVLIYAICRLISPYLGKRDNEFLFEGGFIKDTPKKDRWINKPHYYSLNNDRLYGDPQRFQLAKSAIHKVLQTNTEDSSFTFGINAQWGAGKTTFLYMMKQYIISDKDIIIIDFNPWLYADGNDLVSVFFDELSKTLKEYDHSLAKNIIDYSKIISSFNTNETKIISSLINLLENENSLQNTKQQIVDAIYKIKKKIVVFIDDLDRLDASELMEMFKLIRNVSDFPFMYFISAYDKSYIIQCLKSKMNTKEVNFVEKIFQVEFHLPPYPSEEIRKHLYYYINSQTHIEPRDKKLLYGFIFESKPGIRILKVLTTLREVKRIANSFCSSYPFLRNNTYVIDLLLFELFKTKYSSVFELFEQKKDSVLELYQDFYILYHKGENNEENIEEDNDTTRNYLNKVDFIEYIQSNLEKLHISDFDARPLIDILHFLFSSTTDIQNQHRINHKDCFDRYIRLSVFESEISDEEFKGLFIKELEEIKHTIQTWSNHRSYSLWAKIKNYQPKNKKEYKLLIHILFYYISLDVVDTTIDFDSINKKVDIATHYISNKNEAIDFINNCMLEYGYNHSIGRYISYLYNYNDQVKARFAVMPEKKDLVLAQAVLFQTVLLFTSNFLFIIESFNTLLTYSITDHDTNSLKEIDFSDDYNHQLIYTMREFVSNTIKDDRNRIDFIQSIIVKTVESHYTIISCVQYIWESWDGLVFYFEHLYNKHKTTDKVLIEFFKFLEVFKGNDYEPIEYTFDIVKPSAKSTDLIIGS